MDTPVITINQLTRRFNETVAVNNLSLEVRVAGLKQVLELPGQVLPLCVVALGYPAAKPEPPARRYDATRLHHNHW